MLSFCLIILLVNIDAFSYGVAYGAQKQKFSILYIILTAVLSTFYFSIALMLSKHLYSHFSEQTLEFINGIILILLGLSYIIPKKHKEKTLNKEFKFSFKLFMFECLAISVDAIFTAILTNFSGNYLVFFIIFYFFTNFIAIYIGNQLVLKISKLSKLNLSFFSCFIFILLGFFKIIGF